VGATTGAKHVQNEGDALSSSEGLYWKYESWIKCNESRLSSCTAVAGEALALRRELFPQFPQGVVNDDFYILLHVLRAGYRLTYVPEAESWERVSQSAKDEVKRRTRITAGRFQALTHSMKWLPWKSPTAVWQIISHKYLRLTIPFAMLLALVSNLYLVIAGSVGRGWAAWLMAAQVVFYLLAAFGNKIELTGFGKVLYLPAFLVNSNLATLRGFFRQIHKKQNVAWEKAARR
jgi:cellulose synthase/poly-beta-1,6-N-acetylglucosamine synthase-like glycosyltransferase